MSSPDKPIEEFAIEQTIYDDSRGMDVTKDKAGKPQILIHANGNAMLLKNVKFYDPISGFIQTEDRLYIPQSKLQK